MRALSFVFLALASAAQPVFAAVSQPWSILWVLDNSGSMQNQRNRLATHAPAFVKRLRDQGVTEFRMALTTTDWISQEGKLIQTAGGVKIVDSQNPDAGAAFADLANAVTDSPSSFWEQGLESSRGAILKEGNLFLRDGDPLAVVYISDEDDYSCEQNCFGVEPEHNKNWKPYALDRYLLLFSELKAKRNIDTLLFPIVGILEGSCDIASYGVRYLRVLTQVGGQSGSVCGAEFDKSLFAVADRISKSTPANKPPVVLVNPVVLPDARVDFPYTGDLSPFVKGSGRMVFSKVSGPSWLAIGADGTVGGIPKRADLGENQFAARVCNGKQQCADFVVRVNVLKTNHPPVWKVNPVQLGEAIVNQAYIFDLGAFVLDPDGDPIACQAVALPAWLTMSGCTLMGTPSKADIGMFRAVLRATDANGMTSTASALGSVKGQ